MTHYWTRRRWWSLGIHIAFVSVPFTLSTVSALIFWHDMFGDWTLAIPMVAVIEVLALVGLVLFLTHIESPFVALRHLLPFISIIPLGRELYLLLAHNAPWVAWSLTLLTTSILVVIAWQCFRTIERLFIDPMDAAREKAHEQAVAMEQTLAQAEATIGILRSFTARHLEVAPVAGQQAVALPAPSETIERFPLLMLADDAPQLKHAPATDVAQPATDLERIIYGGVIYNNERYPSISAAATAHGITRQAMSKRLKKEST